MLRTMLTIIHHANVQPARLGVLHSIFAACLIGAILNLASFARADSGPLSILHAPVKVALNGQSISVRARVSGGAPPLRSVALLWAPSRDAAPYRISMQDTGTGIFAATIPETLFAGLDELYYYLEAVDADDAVAETAWYTVKIRSLAPRRPAPASPAARQSRPARGRPAPAAVNEGEPRQWVKPALIGGGILAAGAATYALTQDSGGGSGSRNDENPPTSDAEGTYLGNVTLCFQPQGSNITCNASAITFAIDANGLVTTDDLGQGETLGAQLSGSSFVFAVPDERAGFTGEIQYVGTVIDNRIVGTVQGSATDPESNLATYSGTFTASRR